MVCYLSNQFFFFFLLLSYQFLILQWNIINILHQISLSLKFLLQSIFEPLNLLEILFKINILFLNILYLILLYNIFIILSFYHLFTFFYVFEHFFVFIQYHFWLLFASSRLSFDILDSLCYYSLFIEFLTHKLVFKVCYFALLSHMALNYWWLVWIIGCLMLKRLWIRSLHWWIFLKIKWRIQMHRLILSFHPKTSSTICVSILKSTCFVKVNTAFLPCW